jgi:1,4-dihydroxy-2-naphthoate octaprenyltransferase
MATAAQWVAGARPRTLPAALAPVLVGTGAAAALDGFRPVPALLALVVALALQVAVNYANDYSDGRRGTDADRVGPMRLVGSGAAAPRQVLVAACLSFGVAGVAGLGLAALSSWWLVAVGAVCMVAAWTYTGGPIPYGYRALGEVFVFVFFGPVAVVGTTYVQTLTLPGLAFAVSVPVGFLIVAILVVNNLRDIDGDALVGRRTLAVLLGDRVRRRRRGRPATAVGPAGAARFPPSGPTSAYGARRRAGDRIDRRAPGHRTAHPRHRRPAGYRARTQRMS